MLPQAGFELQFALNSAIHAKNQESDSAHGERSVHRNYRVRFNAWIMTQVLSVLAIAEIWRI